MENATWKKGYHAKIDAKVAYAELEKIRAEGEVTADTVVASAKPKDSPLHAVFEWNNTKAAGEFRKEQARRMLRSVEVVHVESPDRPSRVYETKTIRTESGKPKKVYTTVHEILADPVARDELLLSAVRDALSYRKRYAALSELATVIDAIDNLAENAKAMIK